MAAACGQLRSNHSIRVRSRAIPSLGSSVRAVERAAPTCLWRSLERYPSTFSGV